MVVPVIKVDIAAALKGLKDYQTEKIPLAARSALNRMCRLGILAMQRRVRLLYHLRSDWVVSERRFEIQPAHRGNLTAILSYGPDYWIGHEGNGFTVKTARSHAHVAVPIGPWAFRGIPRALRPKALLAAGGASGFYAAQEGPGGRLRRISRKAGGIAAGTAFILGRGHNQTFIAMRTDNSAIGLPSRIKGVRLLYWLAPAIRFKRMLQMHQTVQSVVRAEFNRAFADYLRQAANWR